MFICSSFAEAASEKGSAPFYEDSFDMAAGGASLTRASQAGLIFSNPALIPLGVSFHRWFGNELVIAGQPDTAETVKSLQGDQGEDPTAFAESLFEKPQHFGYSNALSYINRSGGFSAVSRLDVDLSARRYGDYGLPDVRLRGGSYHGAGLSLAGYAIDKVLTVGVTAKYIYAAAPDLVVSVSDQTKVKELQSGQKLRELIAHNTGVGFDLGSLLFFQGYHFDTSIAAKVDDLGSTALSGSGELEKFKQVVSFGLGLTLHSDADALHLSADYRDVTNAYNEPLFKKLRLGMKATIRTYFGFALGLYDGYPSYGAELDLLILRVGLSVVTKELGTSAGMEPRKVYLLSLALGM
jgi:hypothetical protein